MFLLDANVLAEPTKPRPNKRLLARLREHAGQLSTASVVWHELNFGVYRLPDSQRRRALEDYMSQLSTSDLVILPYDVVAAKWHASQRARLQAVGATPPFADGQIASVAAVNGLILVTQNLRDFTRFDGLTVVDWTQP